LEFCPSGFIIILNSPGETYLLTKSTPNTPLSIYRIGQRYCLSIFNECSGPEIQTTIKFINTFYRTSLTALPATGAYIRVYIPRMINKYSLEMSDLTLKGFNF
jgi:hypothetical protein